MFQQKFGRDLSEVARQQKLILSSFEALRTDRQFMLLLSAVLAVGNVCNAGDPKKGRADGYNYDALHATFRSKTVNGDSMLKYICQKLAQEDAAFKLMKSSQGFQDCQQAQRTPIVMVQGQMDQMKSGLATIMNIFKKVKLDDPDVVLTPFGKKTEEFLQDIEPQVNESLEKMSEVHKEYEKTCDFFMLDKADERRKHSEKFFEFFNEVFENVEKAFPKAPRKSMMGLNAAMLAELQRRQAQMRQGGAKP